MIIIIIIITKYVGIIITAVHTVGVLDTNDGFETRAQQTGDRLV